MSLVQRKQAEIDALMVDVRKIQTEIEEILAMTTKVSEKIAEIGSNVRKTAPALGQLAKIIASGTKYKKASKDIGNLITAGAEIAGDLIDKAGQWYAERKRRKANEKMMPKKQEIARAKMDSLIRLLPKIEDSKDKAIKFLKHEAAQNINDYNDEARLEIVTKDCKSSFESYFILQQCEVLGRFLKEEFTAWLDGKDESEFEMPESSAVYYACVGGLIEYSALPTQNLGYDLPTKLTLGANLLFCDKDINEYSPYFDEFNQLKWWLVGAKTKATFLPITKKAKLYSKFFDSRLAKSTIINYAISYRNSKYKKIFIALALIGIIIYLFI